VFRLKIPYLRTCSSGRLVLCVNRFVNIPAVDWKLFQPSMVRSLAARGLKSDYVSFGCARICCGRLAYPLTLSSTKTLKSCRRRLKGPRRPHNPLMRNTCSGRKVIDTLNVSNLIQSTDCRIKCFGRKPGARPPVYRGRFTAQ
jgi:hypothetical protein